MTTMTTSVDVDVDLEDLLHEDSRQPCAIRSRRSGHKCDQEAEMLVYGRCELGCALVGSMCFEQTIAAIEGEVGCHRHTPRILVEVTWVDAL